MLIYYIREFFSTLRLIRYQVRWHKANTHNNTIVNTLVDPSRASIGKGTYGRLNIYTYNSKSTTRLIVGNYCSISSTSIFMLGGGHELNHISMYPFGSKLFGMDESLENGDIVIADDAWIGERAIIMSGVHIGQGAVVGAGAIVNKDVPDYAIVAGVPARIIRYRFEPEIIEELKKIDFSRIDENWVKDHIDLFYREADAETIKKVAGQFGYEEER